MIKDKVKELKQISFTENLKDTHTALALQTCIELGVKNVFVAGYDGYEGMNLGQKEIELLGENELLFNEIHKRNLLSIKSVTPTAYALEQLSIYSLI